jgi:hypothetical protein
VVKLVQVARPLRPPVGWCWRWETRGGAFWCGGMQRRGLAWRRAVPVRRDLRLHLERWDDLPRRCAQRRAAECSCSRDRRDHRPQPRAAPRARQTFSSAVVAANADPRAVSRAQHRCRGLRRRRRRLPRRRRAARPDLGREAAGCLHGRHRPSASVDSCYPTGEHRAPSGSPTNSCGCVGCSYRGQPTQRSKVRNAIGANMSFAARSSSVPAASTWRSGGSAWMRQAARDGVLPSCRPYITRRSHPARAFGGRAACRDAERTTRAYSGVAAVPKVGRRRW